MLKILFVCMGNICRSPTAEAVFRHYVANRGLESEITADSAGTHGYQFGDSPDPRAVKIAQQRGYDMGGIFCRKIERKDFTEFDFVLAMDHDNLAILNRLRPADSSAKLSLLMQYCKGSTEAEVPDPYYGTTKDFERALDLIELGARDLLVYLDSQVIARRATNNS